MEMYTKLCRQMASCGYVVMAVEHQDDGETEPSLAHSSIDDAQLEQCVLRAFRRWNLPGARDGSAARVYFSISFVPG